MNMRALIGVLLALAFWDAHAVVTTGVSVCTGTNVSTATSITSAGVATQATGSTFVAVVSNHSGSVPTLADNKTNTWTQSGTSSIFGNGSVTLFYCINCIGGSAHTVTASYASAATSEVCFAEFTGVGAGTLDLHPVRTFTGSADTSAVAPSITTSVANELVVDAYGTWGVNAQTLVLSGSGFSTVVSNTAGASSTSGANAAISWALPGSSGTSAASTFSWTGGSSDYHGEMGLSIIPAGGSTCTNSMLNSAGGYAVPDGSSGSYYASSGAFATPNCSSGSYLKSNGAYGAN